MPPKVRENSKPARTLPRTQHKEKNLDRGMAGVAESCIAQEVALKEQKCRERFEDSCHLLKKSRNPCTGELTPRNDAEFLIPMKKTIKQQLEEESFREFDAARTRIMQQEKESSDPIDKVVRSRDIQGALSLRERRNHLSYELEQMRKVIEFKRKQLVHAQTGVSMAI